jgi:hypothetical protein
MVVRVLDGDVVVIAKLVKVSKKVPLKRAGFIYTRIVLFLVMKIVSLTEEPDARIRGGGNERGCSTGMLINCFKRGLKLVQQPRRFGRGSNKPGIKADENVAIIMIIFSSFVSW